MPSTFYALPLAQRGESFLLQTKVPDAFSILVDVGRKLKPHCEATLAQTIIKHAPATTKIDRLVITHADADHCEGAPQFIEEWTASNRSIQQVWLPALWLPGTGTGVRDKWSQYRIIKGALQAAPEIAKLIKRMPGSDHGADTDGDEHNESDQLTKPFRYPDTEAAKLQQKMMSFDELFDSTDVDETGGNVPELERADYDEGDYEDEAICHAAQKAFESGYGPLALELACMAIQTHAKIAPVVAACQKHRLHVRWFDYLLYASRLTPHGGDSGLFEPVNSVEITPKRARASSRAMFLALFLTRANRESLVFLRHHADGEPAVLFTADSRLKVGRRAFNPPAGLPAQDKLLATAPHHGSKSNSEAYGVLKSWLGNYPPILVQNGGHGVTRTAAEFKAVANRLCVLCIGRRAKPHLVTVDAPNGRWVVPRSQIPCSCS